MALSADGGWMALAAPALTAFAKPATFKEYKLVKMRNLPYDFVKGRKRRAE